MENNKLKVKDLVNIGIFSALYMAIAMVVMLPVGITPVLWLLWPGIAGLFGGAFFTLLLAKVPKMGSESCRRKKALRIQPREFPET